MGNQLLKGYTMQGEPVSCVGCEKMWRIYQGIKNSTNKPVTIFAIQKRALNKAQRQDLVKFAKKEAMGLARIRHPGVLAISQTLIQDENIIAFSTQPILGNLTMLAKQNRLSQIVSNQIQLRLNLFPLLDTIQFLHDNVKTVHLLINFDNIYITKEGKWKIAGFSNSQIYSADNLQQLDNSFKCGDLSYQAPQVALQKKFEKRSDVYSMGVLILNLLQVLYGRYSDRPIGSKSQYQDRNQKELIQKINNSQMQKIQNYKQLKILLKNVFTKNVQNRISMYELSNSKWLNDKLVLAVRYLQNITNYDSKQQTQFLKGLMGILNNFSHKILLRKIIPGLMDLLKFKHLIPSVIYISIQILKDGKIIKNSEFIDHIWPYVKKVLQGKQITANSLYLIVDNIPLIQKIVSLDQLTQTIMPLYIKCFDCPPKLKILALHKTDYILSKMDYQFVKAKFLPKIMACMKDSNSDVHKKSLIALKKCIKILDVQTITSQVLGGLENSRKAGTDPFINAISVSIYNQLAKTLPTQILSSKLIPTVLPYLTDPSVSSEDFYNYKTTLLTMLQKIESQRKKYWDESRSQVNQQKYTEKDFEFQQQNKNNELSNQNKKIGGGGYEFLNNYDNNNKDKQQDSRSNSQHQQEQFSRRDQPGRTQQSQNNYNSSFESNYQQRQQSYNNYKNQSNKVYSNDFSDPWSNLSTSPTTIPKRQEPIKAHNNDMGFYQQSPVSNPRSQNQAYPKLKGPEIKKQNIPRPEPKIDHSDPWSALDSISSPTTTNSSLDMNFGQSNSVMNMNFGHNQNTQQNNFSKNTPSYNADSWGFQQPKANNPSYNIHNNTNSTSNYGGLNYNMENINTKTNNYSSNNDPFAQISGGTSNMGMNMGMNMGINSQMTNNYGNQNNNSMDMNFDLENTSHQMLGGYSNNNSNNKSSNFDFDLI